MAAIPRGPGGEGAQQIGHGAAHIGVVIARHEAHVMGIAQGPQPGGGQRKLGGQADVEHIPGHHDVVRLVGPHVRHQPRQHIHVMDAIAALPVDVAGQPLADQLARARLRQRSDMGVGKMGDEEAGHGRSVAAQGFDVKGPRNGR